MNQKRLRKRSMAWLLVLSMVLSLTGGVTIAPQEASAATGTEATINFNKAVISGSGYYTYPDVEVSLPDTTKRIHNLTVTVDSGYIKVTTTTITDQRGTKVTGNGILTADSIAEKDADDADKENAGLNAGSGIEALSTDSTSKYESVSFDFDAAYDSTSISPGAQTSAVEDFLKTLRFTTSTEGGQTVTITATTLGSSDLKTTINGKEIQLYYYNGHFYGYVSGYGTWREALDESSGATFKGVQGYLATLTSRGEDRFLYSTFPQSANSIRAQEGWIGCTRATTEAVDAGTEAENLPKITSNKDENFRWRWVTGPEKGEEFGYQTNAWGSRGLGNSINGDGGFSVDAGKFSNWGIGEGGSKNYEPNGGDGCDEAFGFFGRYDYGRWNDYDSTSGVAGYYIEFGGMDGDDETFQENLGEEIIVTSEKTESSIVNPEAENPTVTAEPEKKSLTGKPVVELYNSDTVDVGSKLTANTDDVGPDGVTSSDYEYVWYVQDSDGVWNKISGVGNQKTITLTNDTLNHPIKVELEGVGDYEDSTVSSDPFDATRTKEELTGTLAITTKNDGDALEPGTVLKADLSDIGPDTEAQSSVDYQWYVVDPDTGEKTAVGKNEPTYVIKQDDLGKNVVLEITAQDDSNYTGSVETEETFTLPAPTAAPTTPPPSGSATAAPKLEEIGGRPVIENPYVDDEGSPLNQVGTVLTANIDSITPTDAQTTDDALSYQWYIRESSGLLTPIDGATEQTLTLTEDTLNQKLVVAVTGNEDAGYYGTRNSFPYEAAEVKTAITGEVKIVNETTATGDDGKEYEVVREGTILTADIDGVDPDGSHDTLTYQWYVKDGDSLEPIQDATDPSYELTTAEVGKELVVQVTGNGKYKGTLSSDPYDAERTDSDVKIGESDEDGKRTITVSPIMEDTVYAIVDASGDGTPLLDIPTVDENGFSVSPNIFDGDLQGYYRPAKAGGELVFTVDKDKEYVIYAKRDTQTDAIIVGPDIDDVTIKDYDDKDTLADNEDDTVSLEVNPADTGYKYAILQKVDGKYHQLTVEYDEKTGEYKYDGKTYATEDPDGSLTSGGEGKVIFSNLPADGTYKVVAIPVGTTWESLTENLSEGLSPDQIKGGSDDVISTAKPIQSEKPTVSPDASASPSGSPAASASPSGSPAASPSGSPKASASPSGSPAASAAPTTSLTPEQQSNVDKFVKEHGTDSSGQIITEITDLTKDIIESGESEWNKMTAEEQSAVNERLKAGGSAYTYPELLEMAKAYKIPGFKLHKVMKKKTKSKLKLMKCKGATVIVTSTNKKVATVNKKGVIKAKKKGKAKLTITVVKGKYSNRLIINMEVRKKFRNATELKKFKSKVIKTPTILIAKKRKLKKSTKIKIYGLAKNAKVTYKSYNKKALPITKKGRYTAKKKGRSLMRVTVKQNNKTYFLYLYVSAFKKGIDS